MKYVTENEDGTRTVWHGGYGWHTKHDVAVHWYAGTDADSSPGGFIEILEIRDAPRDRHPFVLHAYYADIGSSTFEFGALAEAEAGRKELFSSGGLRRLSDLRHVPQLSGCRKAERSAADPPWMYRLD